MSAFIIVISVLFTAAVGILSIEVAKANVEPLLFRLMKRDSICRFGYFLYLSGVYTAIHHYLSKLFMPA